MDDPRKCYWCGKEMEKPDNWSQKKWQNPAVYCSQKHAYLARRADCSSYLGRYMVDNDVLVSQLHKELTRFIDIDLQITKRISSNGLPAKSYKQDSDVIAVAISMALHKLTPEMEWGNGVPFDYRLILNERPEAIYWDDSISGRTGLVRMLNMCGGTVDDLISLIRYAGDEYPAQVVKLKERLEELCEKRNIFTPYGEKPYISAIRAATKTYHLLTSQAAFSISKLMDLRGEVAPNLFKNQIKADYRMILDPIRRQDYFQSLLKSKFGLS